MCNIAIEICELIVLSSSRGSTLCLCVCVLSRKTCCCSYYIRCSYVFELYVIHGDNSDKHKFGRRGFVVVVDHVVPNSYELLSSLVLKKIKTYIEDILL